uniref:Uncharacterized protein n=1 Tax=Lygus hesperus TaxID=30085 RepID=A0A146M701_LYGHE
MHTKLFQSSSLHTITVTISVTVTLNQYDKHSTSLPPGLPNTCCIDLCNTAACICFYTHVMEITCLLQAATNCTTDGWDYHLCFMLLQTTVSHLHQCCVQP